MRPGSTLTPIREMNIEQFRKLCLSLPGATEDVKWENDLIFSVGQKMFAGADLLKNSGFGFKCSPDKFAELIEREGIRPAPYAARFHWVSVDGWTVLDDAEVRSLIREAYDLVRAKLPKKVQATLPAVARGKRR